MRNRVTGLLYAGYRTELHRAGDLDLLGHEAGRIAQELLVRDLVDERVRAMRVRETLPAAGGARPDLSELFARLRQVAARTTDPRTAQSCASSWTWARRRGGPAADRPGRSTCSPWSPWA